MPISGLYFRSQSKPKLPQDLPRHLCEDLATLEAFRPQEVKAIWLPSFARENHVEVEGKAYRPQIASKSLVEYTFQKGRNLITNRPFQEGDLVFISNFKGQKLHCKTYQLTRFPLSRPLERCLESASEAGFMLLAAPFFLLGLPLIAGFQLVFRYGLTEAQQRKVIEYLIG